MEEKSSKEICTEITQSLIRAYFNEGRYDVREESHNLILDLIVEKAIKMTKQIEKKFGQSEDDKIYGGDMVVIAVDDNPPFKYYMEKGTSESSLSKTSYDLIKENYDANYNCVDISIYSNLGREVIGRYVGDTVKFSDDEGKNEHTARIIAHERTEWSKEYNRDILLAEIEAKKIVKSK